MSVVALVVGAGRGDRLRASLAHTCAEDPPPKAFLPLAGRPLLAHAIEALAACEAVDRVVPVVAHDALGRVEALRGQLEHGGKLAPAVVGGAERQDSVRLGVAALAADVEWVAVHDAARPLVRTEDVTRVVAAARIHGAAILAIPVADTLKLVREGVIRHTPPRSEYWAAQTPQVFRADWLREALAKAEAEGFRGTDDAALVERLGVPVHVVEGAPGNWKVTTALDWQLAEAALGALRPAPRPGARAAGAS